MWGALTGDFVGSAYEDLEIKGYDLQLITADSRLTDDSFLLTATADALLHPRSFAEAYRDWAARYPATARASPAGLMAPVTETPLATVRRCARR